MNKRINFIDLWNEDFEASLKSFYGDRFYKMDEGFVYLKEELSLLSIMAIPFRLFGMIIVRLIGLIIMLCSTPFIAANSLIISK